MSTPALTTALCLPALDIEALLQGRMIVALSNSFRNPSYFLLCPVDLDIAPDQLATRYHSEFLESVRAPHSITDPDAVTVHAWARSKTCRMYSAQDDLAALAELTAWSADYLQQLAQKRHKLFLLFLQVHRFSQPIDLMMSRLSEDKIGHFIPVVGSWSDQRALPLLSDEKFAQRQKQLIKLSPPIHAELEPLQTELVAVRENSLGAMALDRDLRYLLGWSRAEETRLDDSDLVWIQQLSQVGNFGSGYEFKELVLRSLLKLGFSDDEKLFMALDSGSDAEQDGLITDDPAHEIASEVASEIMRDPGSESGNDPTGEPVGEAGRLDIYCDLPYALVGDCKVGQRDEVSDNRATQLIHLGNTLLSRERFEQSVKILFAAGPLAEGAEQVARGTKMNVMRPETLQRLTELKARHPGAVDLLKLKHCLQEAPYGKASDDKVNQFVNDTLQQLRLRSALVKAVKEYLERTGQDDIGLDTVCAAYSMSPTVDLPSLSVGEVHDLLMELSSPLAGYLGRKQMDTGRDVFYFLRELRVEDTSLKQCTP